MESDFIVTETKREESDLEIHTRRAGTYDNIPNIRTGQNQISLRRATQSSPVISMSRQRDMDDQRSSGIRRPLNTENMLLIVRRRTSTTILPTILERQRLTREESIKETRRKADTQSWGYNEHLLSIRDISIQLQTDININDPSKSSGLSSMRATHLREQYGLNILTPPPRIPLWLLFLLQFTNLFMILLMIAGVLSIIVWAINPTDPSSLYLGILLFIVVIATCYETFIQEAKAESLMEKFRAMIPDKATVIRDGIHRAIPTQDLVIGDIVHLKTGDKIPADCRIIDNKFFQVDQSMITGESDIVDSSVIALDRVVLEARNVIFNGSLAVGGSCMAVVIRTGDHTLIGGMVGLTGDVGKGSTRLKVDIEYFVKVITIFALLQGAVVFAVAVGRGQAVLQAFINSFIVILVANVPQGLPSTVTACLYIVADRMIRENVFVKKLDIIETLGACSCICTDKTGTLTQNKMTVANIWVSGVNVDIIFYTEEYLKHISSAISLPPTKISKQKQSEETELKESKHGEEEKTTSSSSINFFENFTASRILLDAAVLNSRVLIETKLNEQTGLDENIPNGDATELGLYSYFDSVLTATEGLDMKNYRKNNKKIYEIPFNSANKWQMSIHIMAVGGHPQVLFLKGAPDVLLTIPVDDTFASEYTKVYEEFGGQGERVLGFAMKVLDKTVEEEEALDPNFKHKLKASLLDKGSSASHGFCFIGLVTLVDPHRPEVPAAIRDCITAGVKVVMITGDHPITAAAIARKIGLITQPTKEELATANNVPVTEVKEEDVNSVVVHGSTLELLTDSDWNNILTKKEIVFARTSPEQKLFIVNRFTSAGYVVAMTGDGVNDSPALKQAAVGIAMGINGSDVAREAADIILLDDNFASIVIGVKEGRLLFSNLKKSVAYTVSHSLPEVFPVLVNAIVGSPIQVGAILCLCIDLLTELLPAMSLAFEKPETTIMEENPRDVHKQRLVTTPLLLYAYCEAGVIITLVGQFVYFMTFRQYGLTAQEVMSTNNKYFIRPVQPHQQDYITRSGIVYDKYEQRDILLVVQSAWFLSVVIGQACHIWVCRTNITSIFQHGIFSNKFTNIGVILAIGLGCFVVYLPPLQNIVNSRNPPSLILFYAALLNFVALWSFTEGRKLFSRTYPQHWSNKYLAW
eukprot:gene1802-3499_t